MYVAKNLPTTCSCFLDGLPASRKGSQKGSQKKVKGSQKRFTKRFTKQVHKITHPPFCAVVNFIITVLLYSSRSLSMIDNNYL
jgi:hypothetical protein